jgi:hypothetical protein
VEEPGPAATSSAADAPVAPRAPRRPPASAPTPREGALLLEARHALDSDPALTLALVRRHATEFPNSQLAPERARLGSEAAKRMNE